MSGVLWLLPAVFLFVGVAALVLPVKVAVTACTMPQWRLQLAVRPLAGLSPRIPIHDSTRRRQHGRLAKVQGGQSAMPSARAFSRLRRAVPAAPRLVVGLMRPIRVDRLTLDADIGLDDPAETGRLFGVLAALSHSLPLSSALSIAVRPDFSGPRAAGRFDAQLSVVPVALLVPSIRFVWHVFIGSPA